MKQITWVHVNIELLADWLKAHDTDNMSGNDVLDGLEELFQIETQLAKQFKEDK